MRTIGGTKTVIFGGEDLVIDLTDPGKVQMQTRRVSAFLEWLLLRLPKSSLDGNIYLSAEVR